MHLQILLLHLISLPVESVQSGEIKLCVAYQQNEPVVNATVVCHDEESFFDDKLVNGTTNDEGCVLLNYVFDGGFWDSNVDLYCKVERKRGLYEEAITAVKDDWRNFTADFGTVYVTEHPRQYSC